MSSFCSCSERVETDSAKLELTLSMLDLRIPLSSLACALAEIMDSNSSRRSLLFALTALSTSSINIKVVIYTIICKKHADGDARFCRSVISRTYCSPCICGLLGPPLPPLVGACNLNRFKFKIDGLRLVDKFVDRRQPKVQPNPSQGPTN